MATYHIIDTAGRQAYPSVTRGLRPLVQHLKAYKYPYRVIGALLHNTEDGDPRCTSYHTIYTPAGMKPMPGHAIYMRLLMAGVAHNETIDGGLTSTVASINPTLDGWVNRG